MQLGELNGSDGEALSEGGGCLLDGVLRENAEGFDEGAGDEGHVRLDAGANPELLQPLVEVLRGDALHDVHHAHVAGALEDLTDGQQPLGLVVLVVDVVHGPPTDGQVPFVVEHIVRLDCTGFQSYGDVDGLECRPRLEHVCDGPALEQLQWCLEELVWVVRRDGDEGLDLAVVDIEDNDCPSLRAELVHTLDQRLPGLALQPQVQRELHHVVVHAEQRRAHFGKQGAVSSARHLGERLHAVLEHLVLAQLDASLGVMRPVAVPDHLGTQFILGV
mmetsp:Transcript_22189/g.38102  ORF Transcript_22189/g.38102 Transcript_22189/m.38102 type:complete len:275 (-) Transcript_22189:7-831(-)